MPLEIITIPCLSDNYAYLLRDDAGVSGGTVVLIDAPEAGPIAAALDARGWGLDTILLTHHHDDHIAGVDALRARFRSTVIGNEADRARLPALDHAVRPGDTVAGMAVLDVPGHTVGHVAFHHSEAAALFSADSLMVMGCGRLFEGTPGQMWASLSAMAALPEATAVYSGHEYTQSNARFALTVDPDNPALVARAAEIDAARAAGRPTVPSTIGLERATNPFLRAGDPAIRDRLGMADSPDAEVFAEIRRRKDRF